MEDIRKVWETVEAVKGIGKTVVDFINSNNRLNEEIRNLGEKLKNLRGRKEDVVAELSRQEHPRSRKRKREVDDWLSNVQIKIDEAERLRCTAEASGYYSRWRLWGAVQKDIEELTELYNQGEFNNDLCIDVGPCKGIKLEDPSYVRLESAEKNINDILEYLRGDGIKIIGVCGMVSVGKTTVACHVNNRLIDDPLFDYVFWVTVPRKLSKFQLQKLIAEKIGLDHLISTENDSRLRATMLLNWLGSKKFVLILDGIQKSFSLEEVGIPLDSKGRKLLLTSRDIKVCEEIGCQEVIEVETLSNDESWELFKEKHGFVNRLKPDLVDTVRNVASACAGMPLAIVSVAKSTRRKKKLSQWNKVLASLGDPEMGRVNMPKDLFKQLKFSFDQLRSRNLQDCLLYCALFPKGWEIERSQLIAYWIGEQLIPRMRGRKKEFDRGNAIIERLTEVCLLETTKHIVDRAFIKMNDAVRDMAIIVAENFMVKAGEKLTEFPCEEEWSKDLARVSLMRNDLKACYSSLSPNCSSLRTLLLQRNQKLNWLPYSFFINLQDLFVLDLSGSSIESLPETVINLKELKVLILRDCKLLSRIPSFDGKLKKLVELDLGSTGLCTLPNGVDKLDKLRALDLSWTPKLTPFPNSKLKCLSALQCLRIEGHTDVQQEAISCLKSLENLQMDFSDIIAFASLVNSELRQRLSQYCFVCGLSENRDLPYRSLKTVILSSCRSIGPKWEMTDPLVLPRNMEQLLIDNCSKISSLLHLLLALRERDAEPMTTLSDIMNECCAVRSERVAEFWRAELNFFCNLQSLKITSCPSLKHLFSYDLADVASQLLGKLELLQVCDCPNLVEIIEAKECSFPQSSSQCNCIEILLPQHLILRRLPKLEHIYKRTMFCHQIEEIEVVGCMMLKTLPFSTRPGEGQTGPALPQSLRQIRGQSEWWNSLVWEPVYAGSYIKKFFCELNE